MKDTEGHAKHHAAHTAALEALEEQHAAFEKKAAGGSLEASASLAGILDQKRRARERIEATEGHAHDAVFSLRPHVNDAQQLLGSICNADLQTQIEGAVEEALAPYYRNRADARALAGNTDRMRAMGQFFNAQLGDNLGDLAPLADRYLAVLDKTLAGQDVWSWITEE